jgi:hypothetical protein
VSLEDGNYVNPCFTFGISYSLCTIFIAGLFNIGFAKIKQYFLLCPGLTELFIFGCISIYLKRSVFKIEKE